MLIPILVLLRSHVEDLNYQITQKIFMIKYLEENGRLSNKRFKQISESPEKVNDKELFLDTKNIHFFKFSVFMYKILHYQKNWIWKMLITATDLREKFFTI